MAGGLMIELSEYLQPEVGIYEVRGAAGAGKTYRMCQDLESMIASGRTCVLISFSNAAVDEMRRRVHDKNIAIRTIHSFAWSLISPLSGMLIQNKSYWQELVPDIKRGRNYVFDIDAIKHLTYQTGIPYFDEESGELGLSHDEVLSLFVLLLQNTESFANLIAKSTDVLIIDEYQDTNRKLLRCILQQLASQLLIGLYGDPCQTIYLDESKSEPLGNILSDFVITKEYLEYNFRSDQILVHFFNEVRSSYDGIKQQSIIGHVGGLLHVVSGDGELDDEIRKDLTTKFGLRFPAVLSLTNRLVLESIGKGKLGRAVLNQVNTRRKASEIYPVGWKEIMSSDLMPTELVVLESFGLCLYGHGFEQVQATRHIFTDKSIEKVGLEKTRTLIETVAKKENQTLQGLLSAGLTLSPEFEDYESFLDDCDAKDIQESLQFVRVLQKRENSLTIHSAKGLEYDDVILNIDWGKFPLHQWNHILFNYSQDMQASEAGVMYYLFYVGITRAKHNLVIYVNRKKHQEFLNEFESKFSDVKVERL